ncbi:hypothetical protein F5Y12DRAFT_712989 [Xylaria sp. FL1777]|nr:hypothetical protein F5Y12DRAFT_712989 [Xylaria sp. FL1777]
MERSVHDSYTPNWAQYFSSEGRILPDVNLSVDCGICCRELAVTKKVDDDHESFSVLPCGHVFGFQCLSLWFCERPTCPMCRKSWWHHACGHNFKLSEFSGGKEFNIHDLPRVIDPAELPGRCNYCINSPSTSNYYYPPLFQPRPGTLNYEEHQGGVLHSILGMRYNAPLQPFTRDVPPGIEYTYHRHGVNRNNAPWRNYPGVLPETPTREPQRIDPPADYGAYGDSLAALIAQTHRENAARGEIAARRMPLYNPPPPPPPPGSPRSEHIPDPTGAELLERSRNIIQTPRRVEQGLQGFQGFPSRCRRCNREMRDGHHVHTMDHDPYPLGRLGMRNPTAPPTMHPFVNPAPRQTGRHGRWGRRR